MDTCFVIKNAFSVIGIEGSTDMGPGFIGRLWQEANARFSEVAALALTDETGTPVGCWGAMSRSAMDFEPWENDFTKGLYLAGIECKTDAHAPEGWTKWDIPSFRYLRIRCEDEQTFSQGLTYLKANGYKLAGAVQDFTDPATGTSYMYFPVERLQT